SSQNMVVLVDGVRLSENELSGASLTGIAIDTVERIEIVRGGSSVLYGEGATGGVIQVITKRGKQGPRGMVQVTGGELGYRELRAAGAMQSGAFSFDLAGSVLETDNYRANNALDQKNLSAGLQWADTGARAGVRLDSARNDVQLAGSLSLAQFQTDPRQASSMRDYGSTDSDRITAYLEQTYGDWQFASEWSHRRKTARAFYDFGVFGTSNVEMKSKQTQFSPRIRNLTGTKAYTNEFVAGVDWIRWNRVNHASYSQANATQSSRAVYLRDEVRFGAARIAAGARRETFDKSSLDPAPFSTATYSKSQNENAWEVQGAYDLLPVLTVFGKTGKSYRMANADENGYTAIANKPLDAQRSRDVEAGLTYSTAQAQATARVFRHKLTGEIYFDPTANGFGTNVNLAPTQREGVELDASVRITPDLRLRANWQHVEATFIGGPNNGKEMVMVPDNTASLRLNWSFAAQHNVDVGAQWVDTQRYGGDFSNNCGAVMPSYTTLDARYAFRTGPWEFAAMGSNLGDKRYFSNAFGCRSGIYPSSGRQLKLSARYEF
ncbi:MAG TPA: TonB-dependent receptor, partial [Burkholderiaceae bacterium]